MIQSVVVFLAVVANVFGGSVLSHLFSQRAGNAIKDQSWLRGASSMVAVGAVDDPTCTSVFSCADCYTSKICQPTENGKFTTVKTIACPGNTPYCDYSTGSCTTVPAPTCGKLDNFTCLEDGHFPDNKCTVYHVCKDLQAHKFECIITGQVYNADTQTCESSTTSCGNFNCNAKGIKVPHSLYPHYYAYCGGIGEPLVITKCEGHNKLNMTSQLCEPICEKDGILQDIEDCTKYYECKTIWVDATIHYMTRTRLNCPANTGYSPDDFMCVSLDQLSGCKAGIPPVLKER